MQADIGQSVFKVSEGWFWVGRGRGGRTVVVAVEFAEALEVAGSGSLDAALLVPLESWGSGNAPGCPGDVDEGVPVGQAVDAGAGTDGALGAGLDGGDFGVASAYGYHNVALVAG